MHELHTNRQNAARTARKCGKKDKKNELMYANNAQKHVEWQH
jgi:hypothetical protein